MDTIELLTKFLNKIGWNLKSCGSDHYRIQDHEQNDTEYMLWDSAITARSNHTVTEFQINENTIKLIDHTSVWIGTNDNFVLFMNLDMKN